MSRRPQDIDAVEAELESLKPAPVSEEWIARVGGDLSARSGRRPTRLRAIYGLAAAAACVVIGAAVWRAAAPPRQIGPIVATIPSVPSYDGRDDDRPALSVYRAALSESPAALDELLDRHAARSLPGGAKTSAGRVTVSSKFALLP